MEAIFVGGADHYGLWHGNPHPDSTEIHYPSLGARDDMELPVKLLEDSVWINADRGWSHPDGKPKFGVPWAIERTIPALLDAGVDALHPLQALTKGMDAETLARKYKGDVVFIGGVDTQQLLPFGTPDEVRTEVRRLKQVFGPQFVVSPSHEALLPNVSAENLRAMAETAQE